MIPDKTDIISGTSTDTDFNAVPDECDSGLPPGKIDPTTGPIVLAKDGGDVLIRCAASCSRGATGYGVYQGTIGSWYSHAPVAGLCQATCPGEIRLTPSSASSYYLVVPNRPGVEGSYGTAVDAARVPSDRPRAPVATQRCTPVQMLTSCP
jgi:hypothetical protein